jgi:hypothetical protein
MMSETRLQEISTKLGQLQVGGKTAIVPVELVTDTSAYADGDVIGACYKVDGAVERHTGKKGGVISSLRAQFLSGTAINLEVYFFTASVTATDQAAFAPTGAEQKFMVPYAEDDGTLSGPIVLTAAYSHTLNSVVSIARKCINVPFSNDLYVVVVATGAITFSAAADLSLQVGILQD